MVCVDFAFSVHFECALDCAKVIEVVQAACVFVDFFDLFVKQHSFREDDPRFADFSGIFVKSSLVQRGLDRRRGDFPDFGCFFDSQQVFEFFGIRHNNHSFSVLPLPLPCRRTGEAGRWLVVVHPIQQIGCLLSVLAVRERRNVSITDNQVYLVEAEVVPEIEAPRGRKDNAVIRLILREIRVDDGILKVVVSTGVQAIGNSYQFVQRMGKFFFFPGDCVEFDVARQPADPCGDLDCVFDVHFFTSCLSGGRCPLFLLFYYIYRRALKKN